MTSPTRFGAGATPSARISTKTPLRLSLLGCAALVAGAMPPAPVLAQQAPSVVLDTITLKAARNVAPADANQPLPAAPGGQVATGTGLGLLGNRDAMSSPFSTVGYTAELAQQRQAQSVADVLSNDASTALIAPRGSYRDAYRIRGFGYFSYNMLLDGMPGLAPKQRAVPQMFERVELFKGPDSLLNGPVLGGAVGGSINLVPKRAPDEPLRAVTLSYNSRAQGQVHVDLGQRFGANKEFGVRANLVYRNGDGAVDGNTEKLAGVVIGLDYRTDRLRLSGDFGQQDARRQQQDEAIALAPGADVPRAPDGRLSLAQPWAKVRTRDSFAAFRAEYDLSDNWTAYAKLGFGETANTNQYGAAANLQSDGSYTVTGLSFPSAGRHKVLETGLRGHFQTGPVGHDATVAASFWNADMTAARPVMLGTGGMTNIYDPVAFPAPRPGLVPDLDDYKITARHRFSALTVADTLSFADDTVLLTLALRHQRIRSRGFDVKTGAQLSEYDKSATTPAIGLVWRIDPQLSVYANRVESLQQGPTAPGNAKNAGQIFAPTVSRQIEAGLKYDAGNWGGALALFDIRQASGITDPVTRVYAVAGQQRNRGIELSFYGEPATGLRILGGATLLDAKMTRTAGGAFDGRTAVGAPKFQAVIGADYDLPSVQGLTLSGRVIHTGPQYADLANRQQLPAWTRLDLGASYQIERAGAAPIVIRAGIENVLGKDYWASASAGQITGLTRGAPRSLSLSAGLAF